MYLRDKIRRYIERADLNIIDNKNGIGNVPDNMNVDYKGKRVYMLPSTFLKLAAPLHANSEGFEYVREYITKNEGKIASPFLVLAIPEAWEKGKFNKVARVASHEGRHRMTVVKSFYGDKPIEVHLFFQHYRARHIIPEWIEALQSKLIPEKKNKPITGPFFTEVP